VSLHDALPIYEGVEQSVDFGRVAALDGSGEFFDHALKPLYPGVKYRPTLTNINYEDFQILPQIDSPPLFRFMNVGLELPTDDPWESNVSSKKNHLYELFPVKDGEGFRFDIRILEKPESWQKTLGLRYLPNYRVIHLIDNRLLVMIGSKTAWVDLESQNKFKIY
jgi:hypothetical protein